MYPLLLIGTAAGHLLMAGSWYPPRRALALLLAGSPLPWAPGMFPLCTGGGGRMLEAGGDGVIKDALEAEAGVAPLGSCTCIS